MSLEEAIIIDNGSDTIKSGILGDDEPRSFLNPCTILQTIQKENTVVTNPFSGGNVVNWDSIEKVWRYLLYKDLRVTPEERPVFMTEAPFTPPKNREKLTGILFESFNFPKIYLGNQATLSLFQGGKTTGISVTSGHTSTYISPIYEGFAIQHASFKFDYSGSDLTQYYMKTFGIQDEEVAREVKEKFSKVSTDEKIKSDSVEYELPDGKVITIGTQCKLGAEKFFNSSLDKFHPDITTVDEFGGVQNAIYTAIQRMDSSLAETLYKNIVISGGSCLIHGFKDRLTEELQGVADDDGWPQVKVLDQEDIYATWLGASALAGLGSFNRMWVNKSEYEEVGPEIIHRKCM
jgi:actin